MDKITVMIVDDHSLIRQTWERLLALHNQYEVISSTGNAQVAIDTARRHQPNLMLLDIRMVPMDGFEVLKMIRQYSPATRVIGVSLHSDPDIAAKMKAAGASGYVCKNASTEEFMSTINEVMMGHPLAVPDAGTAM